MTAAPYAVLEAARTQAGMSFQELWIAYIGLGGTAHFDVVRAYLAGQPAHSVNYDVLAQAINERFLERGESYPVPYRDELF
jgi:hypothetical protein